MNSKTQSDISAPGVTRVGVSMNREIKTAARKAACIIRHEGCEKFSPDLRPGNELPVAAWFEENKAFVAMYKMVRETQPVIHTADSVNYFAACRVADKRRISLMAGAAYEPSEPEYKWAQRMGLPSIWERAAADPAINPKRHKGDDKNHRKFYRNLLDLAPEELLMVQVAASIIAETDEVPDAITVETMHREILADRNAHHKHTVTEQEAREEMSYPAQRNFRWNNPEGYAQWVEDLKEEMGPWFDESLILPEYKLGTRQHPKVEAMPDLDDMYDYASA